MARLHSLLSVLFLFPACNSGNTPGETGDSGGVADCIDQDTLDVLATHVLDLGTSGALLLGHGNELEAVSMFLFPGYEGLAAQYASLVQVCDGEYSYDPWCDGDLCWQIECTGDGASNVTRGWLDTTPFTTDSFVFEAASADTEWTESSGDTTVTMASIETSPAGVDLSLDGAYVIAPDGTATLSESYPGLLDGSTLTATLDLAASGGTGELGANGVVVALFSGHALEPTGACP